MEVCVDSVQSAINAEKGGANRIELCSNLSEGGMTPSIGLLKVVKCRICLPVFVMIRPRGGDFLYSDEDFEVMMEDCRQVIHAGADGIVFGILTKVPDEAHYIHVCVYFGDGKSREIQGDYSQGQIDASRCQKLLDIVKPLPVTFHRAFDMVSDQTSSLELLVRLGFDRILTSGGKPDVLQGAAVITELVEQAAGRIIVMPGGGINEDNLATILQRTGVKEFHSSARTHVSSRMKYVNSHVSMGTSGEEYRFLLASVERIKYLKTIAKDFIL